VRRIDLSFGDERDGHAVTYIWHSPFKG